MSTLAQRLQRIDYRFALQDLGADYATHRDVGRADQWAKLFTEQGYFEMFSARAIPACKAPDIHCAPALN